MTESDVSIKRSVFEFSGWYIAFAILTVVLKLADTSFAYFDHTIPPAKSSSLDIFILLFITYFSSNITANMFQVRCKRYFTENELKRVAIATAPVFFLVSFGWMEIYYSFISWKSFSVVALTYIFCMGVLSLPLISKDPDLSKDPE